MAGAFRYHFNKPARGRTVCTAPSKDKTQWVLVAPTALQAPLHVEREGGAWLQDYLMSFQYDAFKRHAMTVKPARNSSTHTPRRTRLACTGSDIHCR